MGDIKNGITFVYRWLLKGGKWREFGIFAILMLGFILSAIPSLFLGVIGILIAILAFIILTIVAAGYFYAVQGIALKEAGYPARFCTFNFVEGIKWTARLISILFTSLFNWIEPKIFAIQLAGYALLFIAFLSPSLVGIPVAIIGVTFTYTATRLALTLQIRNAEKDEIGEAMKTSWAYSKGKFWELMAIGIISTPAMLIFNTSLLISLIFAFTSTIFIGNLFVAAIVAALGLAAFFLSISYLGAYVYYIVKQTDVGKYARLK